MRNLILQEFVSVDGMAADPNGSAGFMKVTANDEKEFADKLNAILKVVFSKSLDRAP